MQDRHRNPLSAAIREALQQGRELLDHLSDEIYSQTMPPIFNFGIGSHFRHLLDFHTAFLNGLKIGCIDYDTRERDETLEKDRRRTLAKIDWLIADLRALELTDKDLPLLVRLEDEACEASTWSQSTLLREVQFLQSHTVHHYAMIALMLKLQGVAVNENFGVAISTLKQWRAA